MTQVANATDVGSFISALESARVGIRRGLAGLTADAQTIAHANVEADDQVSDLSNALVQSLIDRTQIQASARIMRSVDQSLGTIIDVTA